jgi:hypothetical protein
MMAANNKPYDAEVEYLEFSGTQYINTNIVPSYNLPFEIRINSTSTASNVTIFGVMNDWHNNNYRLMYYNNYGRFVAGNAVQLASLKTGDYVVKYDGSNTVLVNNTSYSISPSSNSTSLKLYIGANNNAGTANYFFKGKLYYCKFGDLLDFIPVKKNNVGYLYDRVSGELFGNSGSGSFILGPDK